MSAFDPKQTSAASSATLPEHKYRLVYDARPEPRGLRRRDLIKAIAASAAGWPLVASAQQRVVPVVGFINAASAQSFTVQLAAFLKGLGEGGYVDGRNVAIEYRWAEGKNDPAASDGG
jgi:hypothetical protein